MELIVVVCLITIGMWILGLKNALMIGFFAGIMNIIPYAGPVIGGAIGILFGLTYDLGMDFSSQMIPLILKMISVFVIVNFQAWFARLQRLQCLIPPFHLFGGIL